MKEKIRVYIGVYIVNEIDDFYLNIGIDIIDREGRLLYPTRKMMYVGFNDNSFVFLREGQNRKKLTKKIISELVGFSPYLSEIDGDILNSYEVT